ncbi:uncharacterized protein MYCFIDRAFT_204413 [Pseudocercospora fijiensis CIRAD86]|uniref:Ubiquitin-like domain-containing protein n=1 Tax=Pseudocercospora fijiensis (strain CIRAD86) TaxID=383855 RepID=M3A5U3_PSEFD|nr:uncharacterized protein MYCFIDRAFT_204413 [Pseudocercospora fijiensis CIRAD86]EME79996.1 hypothetical protein MYCFIDRAFT_204413 [Pseudocercospora fijiensis CIRAD86]
MFPATEITLSVPITFDLDALLQIKNSDDAPEKQYIVSTTKKAILAALPTRIDTQKNPNPYVREPTFDLHVRGNPLRVQRLTLTVAPSTTLNELMMLIEDETRLPAKRQRIFLSGRIICDGVGDEAKHLPVCHFGIVNGFTIKVVERVAGRDA